ncbi:DMT family transporter [Streptomyces hainanensis]|uniref:DMT family transporter n=1 Tax=Streptomyces hainanensis TaxID=402648 RepID=A0A4R4TRE0_9ACTN|nr:DMT family transporter [Streptomyces hainanensis]TDC76679.1 DMT family transporter [Streptomyces hainanensis]
MERRTVPGFVVLSLIWGSSFALIKVAVDADVHPVWVALWRCLFGALALAAITVARRDRLPRDRATWGHAMVVALLLNSVPFSLLAFGETRVSSLLAGVLNATTPLTTLLFALALVPGERLTASRTTGLLVGFGGVLVMLGVWQGLGDATLAGAAACLGSTLCYGAGFAYTRRFFADRPGSAAALSTTQLSCAAAQLAVAAPLLGGAPAWPGWHAGASLLALGALGTGVAYILNLRVIREAGPTVASTVTYLTPLWSIALGTLFLSEPLAWHTAAGGVLVVAGVLLARSRPARVPKPAPR